MSQRPVIPEESARLCETVLRASVEGEPHPVTGAAITREQAWNAKELLKLYQTQQRFSDADIDRFMHGQGGRPSEAVRDLAALTPESLEERRARMTADFPGKTSRPA